MLNKEPYIREVLRFLTDVLGRMEEHQYKNTARLRKLRVSDFEWPRRRRASAQWPVSVAAVERELGSPSAARAQSG